VRRLTLLTALALLLTPAAAEARRSGATTLSLAPATQRTLVEHGVSFAPLAPATTNGVSFVFPTVGHHWTGGLKLVGTKRTVRVRRLGTFVHTGRQRARLTRRGARLVNRVAGAHVFSRGARFGYVFARVCRKQPCGRTQLGSFTPFVTNLVGFDDMVTEARALGVRTQRFSQVVGAAPRPAFALFQREGIAAVPTVRSHPQKNAAGDNPAHPPATAPELATYRIQLAQLLDSVPHPPLLMVENEEVSTKFFAGTMAQYAQELEAAVQVAHARGIPVTNGGLTDQPVKLLVWKDYEDRGLTELAYDFAGRAFASQPAIVRALRAQPFTGLPNAGLQAAWDRAEELVPLLRHSRMDYVDFHWYTDDEQVLAEVVDYLQRTTRKPVVTTEIGQHNTTPSVVSGHLGTLVSELRLPFVIWFDADGIPAYGLHESIGQLRPNGTVFKAFVAANRDLLR
jgi:hypothetical protein